MALSGSSAVTGFLTYLLLAGRPRPPELRLGFPRVPLLFPGPFDGDLLRLSLAFFLDESFALPLPLPALVTALLLFFAPRPRPLLFSLLGAIILVI